MAKRPKGLRPTAYGGESGPDEWGTKMGSQVLPTWLTAGPWPVS